MSTFLAWVPSILTFLVFFGAASLVSVAVYALAHSQSDVMRWLNVLSSVIASGVVLYIFWLHSTDPQMTTQVVGNLFVLLLLVVLCTALQANVEESVKGQNIMGTSLFLRAFFSYVCSIFYDLLLFGKVLSDANSFSFLAGVDFRIGNWGFMAGLLLAPLSLSFFRWMFQTLALRPGIDRHLYEDEVTS